MTQTNLNNEEIKVGTGLDSVVITNFIEGIPGGRSLNVSGFTPEVIKAGHVVIKDNNDDYKPMPITSDGTAYATLPANHTIVGVVSSSRLTSKAMCPIMVRGTVNTEASPYPVTPAIKTALPLIRFTKD